MISNQQDADVTRNMYSNPKKNQ